ncbi:MAG: hypothetical protein ACI4OR_04335 [Alphaproteobacteria bacterium]
MNEERIVQALTAYQGTEDSLKETVTVLAEELGDNWTETVFEQLGGLPSELKEKLNHTFNYYAALMAWQETQSYLEQKEPLEPDVQERLPVLKHWLDFFGDPGTELYQQLENKLAEPQPEIVQADSVVEEAPREELSTEPAPQETVSPEKLEEGEETPQKSTIDMNSPSAFAVQKAKNEIALLEGVQAWLSARCLQLNNMEVFAYPYYGFAVDLMRQTVKDIQAVLDLEDKTVLSDLYEGGEEALLRKKQAVEADIEIAVQNCESATTALIDENINMDEVRKTLGNLDESTEPEYLGPAPDGFELIQDSDAPLDEKAVKEQYQKLEKEVLAENQETEKKTSQTSKNSVQRKLSFSLKPKK